MSPEQQFQIWDTAVKIGLGALISGIAGFLVARSTQQHDLTKERFRRRLDRLEAIGLAVEAHYRNIMAVAVEYGMIRMGMDKAGQTLPSDEELAKITKILDSVPTTAVKIHDSEGIALMLGYSELAKELEIFRTSFAEFQLATMVPVRFPPYKNLMPYADKCEAARLNIYKLIHRSSNK